MNELELLKITDKYVQYMFFLEGDRDNSGVVQVDLKTFDRKVIQDVKEEYGYYKWHALDRVEELAREGNFPEKTIVAWY